MPIYRLNHEQQPMGTPDDPYKPNFQNHSTYTMILPKALPYPKNLTSAVEKKKSQNTDYINACLI